MTLLVSASLLSWLGVLYAMPMMTMASGGMMGVAALVSSLSLSAVGLFELIWVVGMAAMMFPAMIPIVAFYNRFSTKVEPNPRLARAVGTPLFLAGYLAVYAGLGLAVYFAVFLAVGASSAFPGLAGLAYVAPGANPHPGRGVPALSSQVELPDAVRLADGVLHPAFAQGPALGASGWGSPTASIASAAAGPTCS